MKRNCLSAAALVLLTFTALSVQAADNRVHRGQGTVNQVDAAASKVNMTHGPIQTLKWPGMTMNFVVKDKRLLDGLKSGQKVDFSLAEQAKGQYVITQIAPAK